MKKEIFKTKLNEIIFNIENTNYGSIITEFKLILLIQEFIVSNHLSEEEIANIFWEESKKHDEFEARNQALGEVYMNLKRAHKYTCVFDDYDENYIQNLFTTLQLFVASGKLMNECNQ